MRNDRRCITLHYNKHSWSDTCWYAKNYSISICFVNIVGYNLSKETTFYIRGVELCINSQGEEGTTLINKVLVDDKYLVGKYS